MQRCLVKMTEKKQSLWVYFLIGMPLFIILMIIFYFTYQKTEGQFPIMKYSITGAIIMAGLFAALFVTYKLVEWFISRKSDDESDLPKEYVGSDRILEVWKDTFIVKTGIPFVRQTWADDKIVPCEDDAIIIDHEQSFVDPTGQTSDNFIAFEVIVTQGNRIGVHCVITRLDMGERWVRDNWNWWIKDNTPKANFKLEIHKFPLTSAKSVNDFLNFKRLELAEDYSESELRNQVDLFRQDQKAAPAMRQNPIQVVKAEELRDAMPEISQADDYEVDETDLERNIEAYRNRK